MSVEVKLVAVMADGGSNGPGNPGVGRGVQIVRWATAEFADARLARDCSPARDT